MNQTKANSLIADLLDVLDRHERDGAENKDLAAVVFVLLGVVAGRSRISHGAISLAFESTIPAGAFQKGHRFATDEFGSLRDVAKRFRTGR